MIPTNTVFQAPHENHHRVRSARYLYCINCNEECRDHLDLWSHFHDCVQERGNPTGARWFDDVSVEPDDIPESLVTYVSRNEYGSAAEC